MKTHLTKVQLLALLLSVAFLLAACGGAGGGQQGDEQDTSDAKPRRDHGQMGHGSMGSKSMAKQMVMQNGKYSDERFIDAMVPHHQGAVVMARVALQNAEHEEIEELSRNIIASQQAEIQEMKDIKKAEFGTTQVPMDMSPRQMRGMGMMMNPQMLAQNEPFDRAFIDAMIPHHQSAIEMASVALTESDNPQIKELAKNIVGAQQEEIEQMKRWREQWYPEG